MQRDISNKNTLGEAPNPYDDAPKSTAIDSTASSHNDAKKKVQKIRYLINIGKYDSNVSKYIPGLLELAFQGMLDDIDTREKVAHPFYVDREQLGFQILLTENYYVNPNSIHICFPIKIKKKTDKNADIGSNMITINNFFAHWVKEISITKYGSDKELPPTFSPWEIYQYSEALFKHLRSDELKTIRKTLSFDKRSVYFADLNYDRRNFNSKGLDYTGLSASDIALKEASHAKVLNINNGINLFQNLLKNKYFYRISLRYLSD